MHVIRINLLYFLIVFVCATISSYFVISNWLFKSDFLTYKEFAAYLSTEHLNDVIFSNFLSIRHTEPIFILVYWIFSKYSYVVVPLINLLIYNYMLLRFVRVSWLALLVLVLLQLTPSFQAFHLQRQFMSVIFLMFSLYFTKGKYRYVFWILAILTHNSALMLFPFYFRPSISFLLSIPILYFLFRLSDFGFYVGGDYHLGEVYYFVLAFFSFGIIMQKRISANLGRLEVIIMLIILWCLIFFSPYLGSRLYFTVFFAVIIPLYFYRKISQT